MNVTCVPSEALLVAGEARHGALVADQFPGIHAAVGAVGFPALIGGKEALA